MTERDADDREEKPDWWLENERIKDRMELPPYEPPRFIDGIYKHNVVHRLEREYDCTISFVGHDTQYPEDWEIRVNHEPVLEIGRRRDEDGNTVYLMTADQFRDEMRERLE
jgi:hypothetical protein